MWGWFFFSIFCNNGGTLTTLATQFLNGVGAVAGTGIIQLEFFFLMQDISKIFFAAAWVKLRMTIGATRPREI
jgi:hypothetical protein